MTMMAVAAVLAVACLGWAEDQKTPDKAGEKPALAQDRQVGVYKVGGTLSTGHGTLSVAVNQELDDDAVVIVEKGSCRELAPLETGTMIKKLMNGLAEDDVRAMDDKTLKELWRSVVDLGWAWRNTSMMISVRNDMVGFMLARDASAGLHAEVERRLKGDKEVAGWQYPYHFSTPNRAWNHMGRGGKDKKNAADGKTGKTPAAAEKPKTEAGAVEKTTR
jgi:hypothetical protein